MPPTHRPGAAALWMTGSIGGFCLMAIAARALGQDLDTFEIMLYRSIIGVLVVTAAATYTGRLAEISTSHFGLHFLRNSFHFAGQNLWLFALTLIPLAQLFALEFSYHILVALAAPVILGERLTPARAAAAAVGFVGILIVARPFGAGGLSLGLGAAVFCAVGFAGAALATKRLTRHASITCILFWLTAMQTGMGLICASWDGHIALPSVTGLPWILAIGLSGLGAHFCITKALSLAPASIVTPIDFFRLPLIAVIGMAFYAEPFDLWVFVGAAAILAANWYNLRMKEATRMPQ
ncbi:MAG: DMT family transporter [Albidovulum sp.]